MKNIINYKKILIISFFALVIIGLSLFSVYGFPGSSGGVVIDDGIIAFTKVGEHTWTVPAGVTSVDVLIVGGGGSGAGGRAGRHKGGGGGAGGLVFNPGYSVSPGEEIIIKVGAGGQEVGAEAGGSFEGGNPGESSIFGDLIALGGGAGRRSNASPQPSGDGGSGGGGSYSISGGIALQPTSSTGGYGNQGGSRLSSDAGYGGGGAGNSGNNDGDSPADGKVQFGRWSGGQGLYEVVIGGTIYNFATIFGTDYGEHVEDQIWFAGGGGGGINGVGDSSYGAGGYGGGGRGAYANTGGGTIWGVGSSKGEDGLDNTGGGGGGSREGISGSGGSGIVLIRYRVGSNLQISSLNSGLVGHWSLNEVDYNPSNNTISDLTPYSNHGTNHGATFTTDRFGKEGGAMRFNNGNRIMLQNIEFSEDDNWSFTTWYNLDGDGHNCAPS